MDQQPDEIVGSKASETHPLFDRRSPERDTLTYTRRRYCRRRFEVPHRLVVVMRVIVFTGFVAACFAASALIILGGIYALNLGAPVQICQDCQNIYNENLEVVITQSLLIPTAIVLGFGLGLLGVLLLTKSIFNKRFRHNLFQR